MKKGSRKKYRNNRLGDDFFFEDHPEAKPKRLRGRKARGGGPRAPAKGGEGAEWEWSGDDLECD
jgi:hypothetical protein